MLFMVDLSSSTQKQTPFISWIGSGGGSCCESCLTYAAQHGHRSALVHLAPNGTVGDEQGVGRHGTRQRDYKGTRCTGKCGEWCLSLMSVEEDHVGVGN
jgi:hypothetical protein